MYGLRTGGEGRDVAPSSGSMLWAVVDFASQALKIGTSASPSTPRSQVPDRVTTSSMTSSRPGTSMIAHGQLRTHAKFCDVNFGADTRSLAWAAPHTAAHWAKCTVPLWSVEYTNTAQKVQRANWLELVTRSTRHHARYVTDMYMHKANIEFTRSFLGGGSDGFIRMTGRLPIRCTETDPKRARWLLLLHCSRQMVCAAS